MVRLDMKLEELDHLADLIADETTLGWYQICNGLTEVQRYLYRKHLVEVEVQIRTYADSTYTWSWK